MIEAEWHEGSPAVWERVVIGFVDIFMCGPAMTEVHLGDQEYSQTAPKPYWMESDLDFGQDSLRRVIVHIPHPVGTFHQHDSSPE